ncbi:hypothetical protein RYX36_009090 [Vicia faba]
MVKYLYLTRFRRRKYHFSNMFGLLPLSMDEGLKEAQESPQNSHLENVTLTKEFDKVVDGDLAYAYGSFDTTLQQLHHLYPPLHVSRERVRPNATVETRRWFPLNTSRKRGKDAKTFLVRGIVFKGFLVSRNPS